jgi:hypothetical protein
LNSLPFTVTSPVLPLRTIPTARVLSAIRKSDPASGGNALGTPCPSGWWHGEQVPRNSCLPAATWSALVSVPCAAFSAAVCIAIGDRVQIDVVGHLVVGMVLQVKFHGVALPNANESSGHLTAERPERVFDAVGDLANDLLHLQLDDHPRRVR